MSEQTIDGVLQEPLFNILPGGSLHGTYHWVSDQNRHTFVHLTFSKDPQEPFVTARSNVDSAEIKRQGKALWSFLNDRLAQMSEQYKMPIVHEVSVNEYAYHLPAQDPMYFTGRTATKFYAVYMPANQ